MSEPPSLLFDWSRLRDVSLTRYFLAVAGAILLHIGLFYLFQIKVPSGRAFRGSSSAMNLAPRTAEFAAFHAQTDDRTFPLASLLSPDSPLQPAPPLPTFQPKYSRYEPTYLPYPKMPASSDWPIGVLPPLSPAALRWTVELGLQEREILSAGERTPILPNARPSDRYTFYVRLSPEGEVLEAYPLQPMGVNDKAVLLAALRELRFSEAGAEAASWGLLRFHP